jgi:hypothetical protein
MINRAYESRIADQHRRSQQALTAGWADRIAKKHGDIPR